MAPSTAASIPAWKIAVSAGTGTMGDDLAAAADAALAGGVRVLERYTSPPEGLAVEDAGGQPVTAADRESHAAILAALARLRPGERVRSEEGGRDVAAGDGGRLWIVDPLDGTREFLDRVEDFSVMVGLAVDGEARLGAVYQPAADRLFLGIAEGGAWRVEGAAAGGRAAPIAVPAEAPAPLLRLESRSHPDARLDRLAGLLARDGVSCRVVRAGSAGTKCARVAAGEADLYVHPVPYLREWDTCAGEALARGAGARVTDCEGAPLRYGKSDPHHAHGLFVAAPGVWQRVLPLVRDAHDDRQ